MGLFPSYGYDYQKVSTMKMARQYSVILAFVVILTGCETINTDPDYPTTYHIITSSTLNQLRINFAQNNVYFRSSLSDFGFCSRWDYEVVAQVPPVLDSLTESEAIGLIKKFVSDNPSHTGVKHPVDFQIEKIWTHPANSDGSIPWTARSSNQMLDTLEVLDTEIFFWIKNRELVSAEGNWFPEIYIPKEFLVNLEEAKSLLVGKVVSHYTIAGIELKVTIAPEDVNASTSVLKVLPIRSEDRIELLIVWKLNIPGPVHYNMYVDVMTGLIVRQAPTIVS